MERLQKQRFELKYRISESKAQQVRFFIQNYLKCDSFGMNQPDLSYSVNSLYIDSPELKTYRDTINGDRNRFKLRIRYYDDEDTPVYFEIKRRYNKVIRKKRALVNRMSVKDILSGQFPKMSHLVHFSSGDMEVLEEFSYLQNLLMAKPSLHVSYMREAYEMEHSNMVRVTFDRKVKSHLIEGDPFIDQNREIITPFGDTVILELKFTDRFPNWLQELTELFHLRQESAAKYVDSIEEIKFKKIEVA